MEKTNVMRILSSRKIVYEAFDYSSTGLTNALEIAHYLKVDPRQVFKTLVTRSNSSFYVFVVPSCTELDLKKASKVVNEKSIEMLPSKDLLKITGYIHGGCSPIGMKKFFKTYFDKSCLDFDSIYFSAGRVGLNVKVKVEDILKVIHIDFSDLVKEEIR